ncbi:MAG: anhydro-N-acetylmuramic acid kinase [Ignavibacteria bacterium]
MNKYLSVFNKKQKTVIGVLSGTSVDAIDVVLVKINGSGISTKIKVIDFESYPINNRLRTFILDCSGNKKSTVENICKLNFIIGSAFADSISKIISRNNLKSKDIDLIGSHGQTIYHIPVSEQLFGFSSRSTLQIGDPSVIANQTGIVTVGDFRTADMAIGGEGAPLVPYLDYILFSHKSKSRAFINIGGISNLTYLKSSCIQNDVIAFDSGPGNMIIDYLVKKYFGKNFDKDGKIALSGEVDSKLFDHICFKDKYFKKSPPKSTGREHYSGKFVESVLKKFSNVESKDIIATFTKFTAYSIYFNLIKYKSDEIIISGGGANNPAIFKYIKEYFIDVPVYKMNDAGINPDNKEAVLFAVLANELVSGNKANMPSVSGSERNTFLGKICIV